MICLFTSSKGGQGTSTVAAMSAIGAAHSGNRTLLIDAGPGRAQSAILGLTDPEPDTVAFVSENLDLISVSTEVLFSKSRFTEALSPLMMRYDSIVIDIEMDMADSFMADKKYLVISQCYLALKSFVVRKRRPHIDGIVLRSQEGRALTLIDVQKSLGISVLVDVPTDPMVARSIDAGLLSARQNKYTITLGKLLEED